MKTIVPECVRHWAAALLLAAVACGIPASQTPRPVGTHGFDNADPLMSANFIAHGPAFKSGVRIPAFPNVDVYSLMTRILALRPAPNDGSLAIIGQALK